MEYRVILTESATRDVDAIFAALAKNRPVSTITGRFADALFHCIQHLEAYPMLFALTAIPGLFERGYRRTDVEGFTLLFALDEVSKTVTILAVC